MSGAEQPAARRVDQEAVEADYRAGRLTLREIGALHGCSEGYVRKLARDRGWKRDLSEKIAAQARAEFAGKIAGTQAGGTQGGTQSARAQERAVIAAVAEDEARDAYRARGVRQKLLQVGERISDRLLALTENADGINSDTIKDFEVAARGMTRLKGALDPAPASGLDTGAPEAVRQADDRELAARLLAAGSPLAGYLGDGAGAAGAGGGAPEPAGVHGQDET